MSKRLTTEEFIEKAKKIHGDKYDYSLSEYLKIKDRIKIICRDHGVFVQIVDNHLHGKGCPECKKINIKIKQKKQNGDGMARKTSL